MPELTDASDESDEDFVGKLTSCQSALQVYIIGVTPCRGDADDVLQEVNLALWRKRRQYKPDHDFLRWAFGFAMVEVRNFKAKAARTRVWFSDAALDALTVDWPRDAAFAEDRREALVACLQKLAMREREVVAAFYGRGARADEIAGELGAPLSRIYKTLTRARNLLRGCVERTLAQRIPWEPQA
jgi:RNA polymerase sigma-70 factor, ECF subfamily